MGLGLSTIRFGSGPWEGGEGGEEGGIVLRVFYR